jgi:hypothetical protein
MQAAGAAITTYLNSAFTDTERHSMAVAQGTETLNTVFGRLGIAVPKDWASLNALIQAYSLGDETQQAVAATLITEVVPAFVAVNGTAQDVAASVKQQADANEALSASLHQAARSFMSDAGLSTTTGRRSTISGPRTAPISHVSPASTTSPLPALKPLRSSMRWRRQSPTACRVRRSLRRRFAMA